MNDSINLRAFADNKPEFLLSEATAKATKGHKSYVTLEQMRASLRDKVVQCKAFVTVRIGGCRVFISCRVLNKFR